MNIERSDAPLASNPKIAGPQRPRNMDPTNPPPVKPFRAGSDEAGSTHARTWNIILLHIQNILPSASTGTDINATLLADHLQARLA